MNFTIDQKISVKKKSICPRCYHYKVCKAVGNQPCYECNQFVVDAVKVVHGRWEQIDVQPYFRKHYPNSDVCCSKCHTRGNTKYHYCPNCGAKMDEVSE